MNTKNKRLVAYETTRGSCVGLFLCVVNFYVEKLFKCALIYIKTCHLEEAKSTNAIFAHMHSKFLRSKIDANCCMCDFFVIIRTKKN